MIIFDLNFFFDYIFDYLKKKMIISPLYDQPQPLQKLIFIYPKSALIPKELLQQIKCKCRKGSKTKSFT